MKSYSVGKGETGIEVKMDDELIGSIEVKDTTRDDASEALSHFDSVILSVVIMTPKSNELRQNWELKIQEAINPRRIN